MGILYAHGTKTPARDLSEVSASHLTRFSGGSVSGRKQKRNSRSETAKSRASQGAISTGRDAPSMGPSVKPSEKATPMTACGGGRLSQEGDLSPGGPRPLIPVCALTMPRLRAGGEPRSATMAVERLTFPLLMPPITLDARKAAKLSEAAHTAYEVARPACIRAGPKGRHGHLKPGGAQKLGQQTQQHPWDPALFWDSQGPLVFPLSRGCRSSCRTAWLRHKLPPHQAPPPGGQ